MTDWSPTRRQFLGAAGLGSVPAAGVGNVSWGNVTDAVPDHPFVPTADVQWTFDTDSEDVALRGPTDGTVYVARSGAVHALSTDGTEQWRFEVDGDHPSVVTRRASAYLGDEKPVYVSDDETVYALAADGNVEWRYDDADHPFARGAIPGSVLVMDDGLFALSTDGTERWRFEPSGNVWFRPHFDGSLYVGTTEGGFYALDPTSGTVRWSAEFSDTGDEVETESAHVLPAGTTDDRTFAWNASDGVLSALDARDGVERWRFEPDDGPTAFPGTIRDGAVYLLNGDVVRALSATDGGEKWRYSGSELGWRPEVLGDSVYVGGRNGTVALTTTGRERWRSLDDSFPMGTVDESLVAYRRDDGLYALDPADGAIRWRFGLPDDLSWGPVLGHDGAYFAAADGTVTAVSPPNSTPLYGTYRTVTSPAGLAVGGLLGGALAVGAYRRRTRQESATDSSEPTSFEDFELVGLIAETDRADVHEARAPDGTLVALKRLEGDAISPERFADAVETWADLDVRGVLSVREWGTEPVPWVAIEFADATLADRAEDLGAAELAHVIADAAEAVHRARREGVAHGRLAPETIWFVGEDVRVGDWRLAAELWGPSDDSDTARLATMADDLLGEERRTPEIGDVLSRALADDADRYDSALKFADALRWAVRKS